MAIEIGSGREGGKVLERKADCTIPEAAEFVNLKRQVKSSVSVICID